MRETGANAAPRPGYTIKYEGDIEALLTEEEKQAGGGWAAMLKEQELCGEYAATNAITFFDYNPSESVTTFSFNRVGQDVSMVVWETLTFGDERR
jgi:hypothetical protein